MTPKSPYRSRISDLPAGRRIDPSELGQEVVQQHAYRCDQCGSMTFFADGFLPHPLPGRTTARG
ncbi:hypothetical protein [Nocardia sp. NPDC059691]|uniref:hypothetical protein n=1 Tax=Nocardia sp. NPDC059691 TaxID=3346908 RepID=UPI0036B7D8E7